MKKRPDTSGSLPADADVGPGITRRQMLATSAATVGLLASGRLYGDDGTMTAPRLRKDVRDLSNDEIKKYREAVRRMKDKGSDVPQWNGTSLTMPSTSGQDGQGFAFQALIHTGNCPHHNWWFLPWHRVYLFYFEEILRELVDGFMPDVPLAIPYWNWTDQRAVPPIFAESMDNPLFDPRRHPIPLRDQDVGSSVIQTTVLDVSTFEGFGSSASCSKDMATGGSPFEAGPHGMVHVRIGWHRNVPSVRPWGDLRYPVTAAFDPLFWSHHANIDRLWDVWLASDASHKNPAFDQPCEMGSSQTWGNMKFEEFVDGEGNPMSRTVEEFLTDSKLIAVQYAPKQNELAATEPVRSGPMPQAERNDDEKQVQRVAAEMQLSLGEPLTLTIPLSDNLKEQLKTIADQKDKSAFFRVQNIKVKEAETIPLEVRAYLNKQDVRFDTDPQDVHSLGYFTFFGAGHDHMPADGDNHAEHGGGFSALLNLAPTIRKLSEDELLGDRQALTITLMLQPVDLSVLDTPAAMEPISLPFAGGQLELP